MPSFINYGGMGVGEVGVGDKNAVFKRKFRWTFEIASNGSCDWFVPPFFCKVAARPNISFEETEVNWQNDKMWIPGKATWEAITVTYMDVGGTLDGNNNLGIYDWLTSVFDFTNPNKKFMNSRRENYTGTAILKLLDGCGSIMETWQLSDAWPQAINFGDLDYSSSDIVDIEITLRYSQVSFTSQCPKDWKPKCSCEAC